MRGSALFKGETKKSLKKHQGEVVILCLNTIPNTPPLSNISTFIDPETRQAMGEQAVALAKAVGYSSAGIY